MSITRVRPEKGAALCQYVASPVPSHPVNWPPNKLPRPPILSKESNMSSRRFASIVTAVSLVVAGLGEVPMAGAASAAANSATPDFSAALQARAAAQADANSLRAQLRSNMSAHAAPGNVQAAEQFRN